MDFSKQYLGKSINELEFVDIELFFREEREETEKIEFKSFSLEHGNFQKNIEGVIRGICAFLNSSGGLLIWGAPMGERREGRQEKVFVGDLAPVNELKEKDWLINKISDTITPLPIGIKLATLEKDSLYVYVFEVRKSEYSPHQFKNTYYARLDGQTKPAPHYLIEALFKKVNYPNIELYVKFDKVFFQNECYYIDVTFLIFNFSELINEENVSFRATCYQGIFSRSRIPEYQDMYTLNGCQLIYNGLIDVLHYGAPNMHSERIELKLYDLTVKHNYRVELLIGFGGKKSPLKFTNYVLDFSKLDLNNTDVPNYLIVEKEENILSPDKQLKHNNTKEKTLRDVLKR